MPSFDETPLPVDLFDGTPAVLRSICPADAEALVRFHARLSPETVYRRFFRYHPTLAAREVVNFTDVDGFDRAAFVVCVGAELVAVARYERLGCSDTAEVAFVVADAYQHHGLGALLLERLARRAREVGIDTLAAETMTDNGPMLGVFRESGYPMSTSFVSEVVEVSLDIRSPAVPAPTHLSGAPTIPDGSRRVLTRR